MFTLKRGSFIPCKSYFDFKKNGNKKEKKKNAFWDIISDRTFGEFIHRKGANERFIASYKKKKFDV